jgi:hypothetical protein
LFVGFMPKKRSKLSSVKNSEAEDRKRTLAKNRQQKYREKLKNDPSRSARLKEVKELSKKRAKRQTDKERQLRTDSGYRRLSKAIWRQRYKNKTTKENINDLETVEWDEFKNINTNKSNQREVSQQKRRRKERREEVLKNNSLRSENENLKRKARNLEMQLYVYRGRKRKFEESIINAEDNNSPKNCQNVIFISMLMKQFHLCQQVLRNLLTF